MVNHASTVLFMLCAPSLTPSVLYFQDWVATVAQHGPEVVPCAVSHAVTATAKQV